MVLDVKLSDNMLAKPGTDPVHTAWQDTRDNLPLIMHRWRKPGLLGSQYAGATHWATNKSPS